VIDAGYPGYRHQVTAALEALGKPVGGIAAVVVTHHHVDHVGTADHLRSVAGASIFVHLDDAAIVRGERRSHVPPGFYRQSWRPSMARYLAHTVGAGGGRDPERPSTSCASAAADLRQPDEIMRGPRARARRSA